MGGTRTVRADVRIIAATHRDLEDAVQKGRFRQDLFYRLFVIPVLLPSLKDRPSDIPLLAAHFLGLFSRRNHTRPPMISESAMARMKGYPWPGNVRELRNLMERWVVLHGDGTVTPADLPPGMQESCHSLGAPNVSLGKEGICLNSAVSEFEKALILESLRKTTASRTRRPNCFISTAPPSLKKSSDTSFRTDDRRTQSADRRRRWAAVSPHPTDTLPLLSTP